ncbi:MAG: TetR/AcrR family transcriptional regulator [Micrococcales bacterium]|nr:TetR/AcrR family transcriptional regulator [Micrococcales bacterium]
MSQEPNQPAVELADAVPGAPRMGLRERKRAATMRRLQHVALEQFEEHGFDKVTIEHVAAHADVSPSTVYRYFGTKEALVLKDEYDDQLLAVAPMLIADGDVFGGFEKGLRLVGDSHLGLDSGLTLRRTRVWLETPSVRAAGFLQADQMAHDLARIVAESPGNDLDDEQALSVCTAAVMTVFAAIENWYRGAGGRDVVEMTLASLRTVRDAAARGASGPA